MGCGGHTVSRGAHGTRRVRPDDQLRPCRMGAAEAGTAAEATTAVHSASYDLAGNPTWINAPGRTDTFTYNDCGLSLTAGGPSWAAPVRVQRRWRTRHRSIDVSGISHAPTTGIAS